MDRRHAVGVKRTIGIRIWKTPAFNVDNGLEYRVFRNSTSESVFAGYDQILIRNTSATETATDVQLSIGAAVFRLIDGKEGVAGTLEPGQTWTTTFQAGAQVTVPNATGTGGTGDGPTADFTVSAAAGAAPFVAIFTDASTAGTEPISRWLWDFGDGSTSEDQNPIHTYVNEGDYDVSLTVFTEVGSSVIRKEGFIEAVAPGMPIAAFTAMPTTGIRPLTVQFADSSSSGTSPITAWQWNFGDGSTSNTQSPSHTYTSAGTYTVSLTVTTAVGSNTHTADNLITVQDQQAPDAYFTAGPTTGEGSLQVYFVDRSTAGTSPITSWEWNFGDGSSSTDSSPSHTYASEGTYTVSLTVTSAHGSDTHEAANLIVVSAVTEAPIALFTASPTAGKAPLQVSFSDQSAAGTSSITSWQWNFGDGSTSTEPNPMHTYSSEGTYTVSLTVTTADGTDTRTMTNLISVGEGVEPPIATFTATPTSGDAPLAVNFTDQSAPGTSAITSWQWTFGDGSTSTEKNPAHTYTSEGMYTVSLTVTTADGTNSKTIANLISVAATTEGEEGEGEEGEGEEGEGEEGEGELTHHAADQDGDSQIELSELLRVIQLFNLAEFSCNANTEDGFQPGKGDVTCVPHSSDYNPQDWKIELSELLRLIQFFNSQGYYTCVNIGEDNFCVGASAK